MTRQITIAKPDKSRSCHHCRYGFPFKSVGGSLAKCSKLDIRVTLCAAQTCEHFRDSRQTSQVISASGKVGPA